jgi:hypothetical protein
VSTAFRTLMGALVQFIDERLAKIGDDDEDGDGESAGKKSKLDVRSFRLELAGRISALTMSTIIGADEGHSHLLQAYHHAQLILRPR